MDISAWREQVHEQVPRPKRRADPYALGDSPHPAWQCERLPLEFQERVKLFFLWAKTKYSVVNSCNMAPRDDLIVLLDSIFEYGLDILPSIHEEMEDELRDGRGTFFVCPHHDPHNAHYRFLPITTTVSEVRFGARPFHRVRSLANRAGSDIPADASDDSATVTESSITDPATWSRHSTTYSHVQGPSAASNAVVAAAAPQDSAPDSSPSSALGVAMRRGLRLRSHSAPPVPADVQVSDFRSASVYALMAAFRADDRASSTSFSVDSPAEFPNDLLSQPLTAGPLPLAASPPSLERLVAFQRHSSGDFGGDGQGHDSGPARSRAEPRDCSESVLGPPDAVPKARRMVLHVRQSEYPSPPGTPNGMPPPPNSPLRRISWDPSNPEGKLRSGSGGFLLTPGALLRGPVAKRQRRR
ncbi:hypothetical protein OC844_004653 [Tilletia horrida]|nr:hypothetical protein OC844_004653 [Tilletia horrida]